MDEFLKILQAVLFLKDKMSKLEIMMTLKISVKEILFAQKIYDEIFNSLVTTNI